MLRGAVLADQGLQYKEIAARLLMSPGSVRNQFGSVYRKPDARNKTSLAHVLALGESMAGRSPLHALARLRRSR